MKARRSWTDVIQTLREHKCQPMLLYPAKLSITIDGETKIFQDKMKFTQYLSTNPALQRIVDRKPRKEVRSHRQKHRQQNTMKRPNLRIEEIKDYQLKDPRYIFNKIIEENFPKL